MIKHHYPLWLSLILLLPLCGVVSLMAQERPSFSSKWEVASPAPEGSRQHQLSLTPDGKLLLSWVEGTPPDTKMRFSILEDGGWSAPRTVVHSSSKFAAPPKIIGLRGGALGAAWMVATERADDRYAADIFLARSTDGGRHWSEPLKPYGNEARIYDAQMSLAALGDGLALLWTDSREHASERYQLKGMTLDAGWRPGREVTVDDQVCSCCETDTVSWNGELSTVYRDLLPGNVRDISLSRWNGKGVSDVHRVSRDGWVIEGCPSNGPSVDRGASGTVAAWFSAADGRGRAWLAFSRDGGGTFGAPVELDADASGYVKVLMLDDGTALVAWRGRAGPEEELRLARVSPSDGMIKRTEVVRGEFSRWPSRHLGLARADNDIYLAWTDPQENRVRLARVPLQAFAASA